MAAFHGILLLLPVVLLSVAAQKPQLSKRSLIELAGTVKCSTGKNPFDYIMYGCYCGLGGQGTPKDETDWCCFRHDCCYERAESQGCQTKTDPYHWMCKDKTPECDDHEDKCKRLLCKCDKEIADCFKKVPYNPKLAEWPNSRCQESSPTCEDNYTTQDAS